MDSLELIKALPKAEQHIHIVGSTRPETLLWLIEESDEIHPFESLEEVESFFQYSDFDHFISVYSTVSKFIVDERQFERITYEMLESSNLCNVRYVEASFSAPDHVKMGLDYGAMLDAINRGIKRACGVFDVKCNLRIDLVRNYGPDHGMVVLDWIEEKGDNIIAVDIGGSEQGYPPEPYKSVYNRAKEMGLHLTAHAGEAAGPESIWGAILHLGVERIGHGTSAVQDPLLMAYLRDTAVTIETCPVSNVRTNAVSSVREHPIRSFIDNGINVTVNSDDPSMFGTDMNNEYIQLSKQLGFTIPELFQLSLNAVDSSFLQSEDKGKLRMKFMKEYQQLKEKTLDIDV